jgi:hypothetical protein
MVAYRIAKGGNQSCYSADRAVPLTMVLIGLWIKIWILLAASDLASVLTHSAAMKPVKLNLLGQAR